MIFLIFYLISCFNGNLVLNNKNTIFSLKSVEFKDKFNLIEFNDLLKQFYEANSNDVFRHFQTKASKELLYSKTNYDDLICYLISFDESVELSKFFNLISILSDRDLFPKFKEELDKSTNKMTLLEFLKNQFFALGKDYYVSAINKDFDINHRVIAEIFLEIGLDILEFIENELAEQIYSSNLFPLCIKAAIELISVDEVDYADKLKKFIFDGLIYIKSDFIKFDQLIRICCSILTVDEACSLLDLEPLNVEDSVEEFFNKLIVKIQKLEHISGNISSFKNIDSIYKELELVAKSCSVDILSSSAIELGVNFINFCAAQAPNLFIYFFKNYKNKVNILSSKSGINTLMVMLGENDISIVQEIVEDLALIEDKKQLFFASGDKNLLFYILKSAAKSKNEMMLFKMLEIFKDFLKFESKQVLVKLISDANLKLEDVISLIQILEKSFDQKTLDLYKANFEMYSSNFTKLGKLTNLFINELKVMEDLSILDFREYVIKEKERLLTLKDENDDGYLHFLIYSGKFSYFQMTINLIKEFKDRFNQLNSMKRNIVHLAALLGNYRVIQEIIELSEKNRELFNLKDEKEMQPIDCALEGYKINKNDEYAKTITLLIENKIEPLTAEFVSEILSISALPFELAELVIKSFEGKIKLTELIKDNFKEAPHILELLVGIEEKDVPFSNAQNSPSIQQRIDEVFKYSKVEKTDQDDLILPPSYEKVTFMQDINKEKLLKQDRPEIARQNSSRPSSSQSSPIPDDSNVKNKNGMTHLMIAAYLGEKDKVIDLLKKNVDLDLQDDYNGYTALMFAIEKNHIEIVKILMDSKARLDLSDINGTNCLIRAAELGHELIVEMLLQEKVIDINLANKFGITPLIASIQSNSEKTFKLILKQEPDLNKGDINRVTPLMFAIICDKEWIVDSLLEEKVNIKKKDKLGKTALMYAIENRNESIIESLIDQSDIDEKDENGFTALMRATYFLNVKIINMLLQKGADIKLVNKDGLTLLMLAASAVDKFEAIQIIINLLDKGLDPRIKDKFGRTLLHILAEFDHEEIFTLLVTRFKKEINLDEQDKNGNSPFIYAIGKNSTKVIEFLLPRININLCNASNTSPLMLAVNRLNVLLVKKLLAKGANANTQDKYNNTALILAVERNNLDIVKLLLDKSANMEQKNAQGMTAVVLAAALGYEKLFDYLLEKGANLDIKDMGGSSVLALAVLNHRKEIVNKLLDNGVDIDSKSKLEETPLMFAVYRQDHEMIKLLLDRGADLNIPRKDGWTPLMIAIYLNNLEIVKMLLEKEASILSGNKQIENALFAALIYGNLEILKECLKCVKKQNVNSKMKERLLNNIGKISKKDLENILDQYF